MAQADDARARSGRLLAALTPHPHRGDLIAAGALPLALGAVLVNVRFDGQWGRGALLVLTALACALVLGMGLLAPLEGERPRSYQQVLLLSGMALGFVALVRLAQVLGVHAPLLHAGSRLWIFLVVALFGAAVARTRRSAICALVAALAGIVAVLAFVAWAFAPKGPATTRWVLLALAVGLVLAALARRDVQRRESVYLVDAAGVAILALGMTFLGASLVAFTPLPAGVLRFFGVPLGVPGGGWELVLLAAGLGLVAYAGVDGERGPGYVGTLVLLVFAVLAGIPGVAGASLWFWPLALLLVGGAAIAAGLRPRRELPPEPPGAGGARRASARPSRFPAPASATAAPPPAVPARACGPRRPATATCSASRPQLDEAGGAEVAVERERLAHPAAPHQREAGRVDERVLALVMAAEPAPGVVLDVGLDVEDRQGRHGAYCSVARDRAFMSEPAPYEGPRLAEHMIRREQWPGRSSDQRLCRGVVAILLREQGDPERRVDKPHGRP